MPWKQAMKVSYESKPWAKPMRAKGRSWGPCKEEGQGEPSPKVSYALRRTKGQWVQCQQNLRGIKPPGELSPEGSHIQGKIWPRKTKPSGENTANGCKALGVPKEAKDLGSQGSTTNGSQGLVSAICIFHCPHCFCCVVIITSVVIIWLLLRKLEYYIWYWFCWKYFFFNLKLDGVGPKWVNIFYQKMFTVSGNLVLPLNSKTN